MSVIPFDYHSHHYRCGHAVGEMSEYIDMAIEKGMTEFGVSDHGPAYWSELNRALPNTQMAKSQLPHYVAEALQLKETYAGRISMRLGIEADFLEGREEQLKSLLDAHPFDYALGSVHYILNRSIFNPLRWQDEDPDKTYREYYRVVTVAARSGLFDILSHLTAIEAYGPPIRPEVANEVYPMVAEAVAEGGCIVEVNTSGFRKMRGSEPFPNRHLLRELVQRGVPLTFGSDCHRPQEVGFARDKVAVIYSELGLDLKSARPHTIRRGPVMALPVTTS